MVGMSTIFSYTYKLSKHQSLGIKVRVGSSHQELEM